MCMICKFANELIDEYGMHARRGRKESLNLRLHVDVKVCFDASATVRQESPPHERCSTPSCDPGESSCNNEKQTNSFRYLSFTTGNSRSSDETHESFV